MGVPHEVGGSGSSAMKKYGPLIVILGVIAIVAVVATLRGRRPMIRPPRPPGLASWVPG